MMEQTGLVPMTEAGAIVLDWWRSMASPDRLPARRDLDPVTIGPALSRIWLVEWEEGPERFVYRIAGEEIRDVHGTSLRGRSVPDIFSEETARRVMTAWYRVITEPAIAHQRGTVYWDDQTQRSGERIAVPLADDDGRGRFVLGVTALDDRADPDSLFGRPLSTFRPNHNHVFYTIDDVLG